MIRTIISLAPEDKHWLDRKAEEENVTMTEMVRRAIRLYRDQQESGEPTLEHLLAVTSGIWTEEDGLEYQRRLREEWEEGR